MNTKFNWYKHRAQNDLQLSKWFALSCSSDILIMVSRYCQDKSVRSSRRKRKQHLLRILKNRHFLRRYRSQTVSQTVPLQQVLHCAENMSCSAESLPGNSNSSSDFDASGEFPEFGNCIISINSILNIMFQFSKCVRECRNLPRFHSISVDGMYVSMRFKCYLCGTFYNLENGFKKETEFDINLQVVLARHGHNIPFEPNVE